MKILKESSSSGLEHKILTSADPVRWRLEEFINLLNELNISDGGGTDINWFTEDIKKIFKDFDYKVMELEDYLRKRG